MMNDTICRKQTSMLQQNQVETRPILHHGTCPTCNEKTSFDLIGIQNWPEKVAKLAGFAATQTIWQCRNCDTTLMEPSLNLNQSA